jgi:transposase
MPRNRRSFTREFKLAAIQLITEQGRSVPEAARNLGIRDTLLRTWMRTLDQQGSDAFPGKGHLPPLEEELKRLRAENQRLQAERDLLKKATVFFAKESS